MTPSTHCSQEPKNLIIREDAFKELLRIARLHAGDMATIKAIEMSVVSEDTRARPAAPSQLPREYYCDSCRIILECSEVYDDDEFPPCSRFKQHQPPASPDALKKIEKTFSEKYDKSDQWDCGYRAGLEQCKRWLNE